MIELTGYTRCYLAVMRIRDLAVGHYPFAPVKALVDLDALALRLTDQDLHDVNECSDTEVRRLTTLCLMGDHYRTPRVHRRAEAVVDQVVKEVFA